MTVFYLIGYQYLINQKKFLYVHKIYYIIIANTFVWVATNTVTVVEQKNYIKGWEYAGFCPGRRAG